MYSTQHPRLFIAIALVPILLTACMGSTTVAIPSPTPVEAAAVDQAQAPAAPTRIAPQPAVLEINGARQTAGIGAFCWDCLCSDPWGVPTQPEPLTAASPVTAQLTLPIRKLPAALQLKIVRVTEHDKTDYQGGGLLWWDINPFPVPGEFKELSLQKEQSFKLELEKGLYVLSLHAIWHMSIGEPEGDVVYGFLIEVR